MGKKKGNNKASAEDAAGDKLDNEDETETAGVAASEAVTVMPAAQPQSSSNELLESRLAALESMFTTSFASLKEDLVEFRVILEDMVCLHLSQVSHQTDVMAALREGNGAGSARHNSQSEVRRGSVLHPSVLKTRSQIASPLGFARRSAA